MNIDDEAERLLRLHPAVRAGVQPEYAEVHWMPRHAVPQARKPACVKPWAEEALARRVEADLAFIDADLERASKPRALQGNWIELGAGKVNDIVLENGELIVRVTFTSATQVTLAV